MPSSVSARLAAAGLVLPAPMSAAANYVPHTMMRVAQGWLVQTAGQGPYADGKLQHLGCIGEDVELAAACASARMVALNVLAQARDAAQVALGADALDHARCLRLGVFLHSATGMGELDRIADAASAIMVAALGDAGRHARSVAGMAGLPMRISVEIDGLFLFEG
jgi:enamine deaminase RidA (YjgF/YER057c/UK114 family)